MSDAGVIVREKKSPWLKLGCVVPLALGVVYGLVEFMSWIIAAIKSATTAARAVTPMIVTATVEVLKLLGLGVAAIGLLAAVYALIRALTTSPVNSFGAIYSATQGRNPTERLRELYKLSKDYPDRIILRKTVNRSRKVIRKQQLIVGILIICIALVALKCYLPVNTSKDVGQVAKKTFQLGTINIIVFAITFYGSKRFLGLDKKLSSRPKYFRAIVLSGVFGTATVLTMILVPFILEESLSGSVVAIELFINIVVDVFVTLYEKAVDFLWKKPRDILGAVVKSFRKKVRQVRRFMNTLAEQLRTVASRIFASIASGIHQRGG